MSKRQKRVIEDYDLSRFRFFRTLKEDEFKRLNSQKEVCVYKKGENIYKEGCRLTGFYCIIEGIVKIYNTGVDGKEQIIRFAKAGDIIAYRSLLSNESACTSSKVLESALVCHVPKNTLLHLLHNNPKFSLDLLQVTCKELKDANNYITDIAQKTVRERLAEIILLLKKDFDVDKEDILQISLTREELANMVGTATETVIRLLSEFKGEGLIELQGRKIRIIDEERLSLVANYRVIV